MKYTRPKTKFAISLAHVLVEVPDTPQIQAPGVDVGFAVGLQAQTLSTLSATAVVAFSHSKPRNACKLVEKSFIPNIENAEVKALFEEALSIFKIHQDHAAAMVKKIMQRQSLLR